MQVIAQKGMKCPMERKPRRYVTDSMTIDVPATSYYRRLLNDGSLVRRLPKSFTKIKTYKGGN